MNPLPDNESLFHLVQRLTLGNHSSPLRIIAFIAARPKEGTSTIVKEYAATLTAHTRQKILIIEAGEGVPRTGTGIVDAMIADSSPAAAFHALSDNISTARWIRRAEHRGFAGQVIYNPIFWKQLLESFDTVLIDAPSLQSAPMGIILAAKADSTILVVEAETTPEAVVKNLHATLMAAGATVAGVVMNKRRYYIPPKKYKKL